MEIHKVLITGITGFVGSHLADYVIENFSKVQIFGLVRWRSPVNNVKHILDKITLLSGDLLDLPSLKSILSEYKPDVVFHLAAQPYVPFSFSSPIATLNTNVIGTCNLLEAVKDLKLTSNYDPTIHICSSSEVYGQVKEDELPIDEETPLRPASPYGVSKVGEDLLGYQYWLSWGIKTLRTRMFTHTGPKRGDVFVVSNFAKQIAAIEAKCQSPVIKVGNLESLRTFFDVRDAVHAYWLLVNRCTPGEVYNIGGVETMTIKEMLDLLLEMSTFKNIVVQTDPDKLRPSDVTLQIPSTEKFHRETRWRPKIKFSKTLEDTLNFWRNHFARESQ